MSVNWKKLAKGLLDAVDRQYSPSCDCARCVTVKKAAEGVRKHLRKARAK